MVFISSILFATALVLPSVMGLTLNTPTGVVAGEAFNITWTTQSGDPTFSVNLVGPTETIDAIDGLAPSALTAEIGLGEGTAPGQYTLQAFPADNIGSVLTTSQPFAIAAAGTAATGGNNAAAGAAAAGTAAAASTTTAASTSGKTAKTGKAAGNNAAAGAAAAKAKGGFHKNGRSVASVKFGRRELYRD
eukprot:GHVU01075534.1.p1 GENE.GHVU01075534.1~~GHVU01075534.1.p1  ORF type:complete len:190 (+),score=28.44 GHVU01075534.1:84-653(+)